MTRRNAPIGEDEPIEVFVPSRKPETPHERVEFGNCEVTIPGDDEKAVHIHEQHLEVAHDRAAALAPATVEPARSRVPAHAPSSDQPGQNLFRVRSSSPLAPAKPRITGSRRRAFYQGADLTEPALPRTAADLRDVLAEALVAVRSGKLDLDLANATTSLSTAFLRVLEVSDVEERLKALEHSFASHQKEKATSEEEPPTRIYHNLPTEITVEIPE